LSDARCNGLPEEKTQLAQRAKKAGHYASMARPGKQALIKWLCKLKQKP
jgi:hypothetical protein